MRFETTSDKFILIYLDLWGFVGNFVILTIIRVLNVLICHVKLRRSLNCIKIMKNICLNSRDDLIIIALDKVAYFQAQGNYTKLCYISGDCSLLMIGLSKTEEVIGKSYEKGTTSPFIRLGRSLIINQKFLAEINLLKQKVRLSDFEGHSFDVAVSKPLLKQYKERINEYYLKIYNNNND